MTTQTQNMAFLRFGDLPEELQQEVMRQCEINDLLKLGRTSQDMNTLAHLIIYQHVDISCHNQTGLFKDLFDQIVEANDPNRRMSGLVDVLRNRQRLFIDTMMRHPDYNVYVTHLTWTYVSCDEELTWKAFQCLTNVKTFDFCSFNQEEEEHFCPPVSFPSASSIRLGGKMPYPFFRALVSQTPYKLVSLDLDNVIGFGQLRDGEPLPYVVRSSSEVPESVDSDGDPQTRYYGPMRGYLRQMQGICINLRHLCLRSIGQDDYRDKSWRIQKDRERYQEWASFIDSVKLTLETLVIEQGTIADTLHYRYDPFWKKQIGRPMDTRFMRYLMPVLLRGPWPKLKKMTIRGVGAKPTPSASFCEARDPAVFIEAEDQLRIAWGTGALIIWETDISRRFHQASPGEADYMDESDRSAESFL